MKFKPKYNIRVRTFICHGVLFALILFCFTCSVLDEWVFFPTKPAVCATILFLIIEYLFDNFLINKRFNINNDEFLQYKFCNVLNNCDCNMAKLLDRVFYLSPEIVTCKDSKLRYTMCSNQFLDFIGKKSDDVIGLTPFHLIEKEKAELIAFNDNLVLKDGVSRIYNVKFIRNGKEQIYELMSSPIISNNMVAGVLTLTRNVTDSTKLMQSLEFSNTRLCLLMNNLPLMAFILDLDGNFIFGNEKAKSFVLNGIDESVNNLKIKYDTDKLRRFIKLSHDEVLKLNKDVNVEKVCTSIDGESYTYNVSIFILHDESGKPEYIMSFAKNIESEKRVKSQRETYISTLTHDLKTPTLAQIRSLELLLSGQFGALNQAQEEMVNLTLDSCKYMYDMLYTLLASYKFERGEAELNYSNFDVMPIISSSLKKRSRSLRLNDLRIKINPKIKNFTISGDKSELCRVIDIFIGNAISYAKSMSCVYIDIKKNNNIFEFKVKNSSNYIPPDVLQALFKQYSTAALNRYDKVGVEMGMYYSKKIVEAHGGKIIAESTQDNTNTFGFSIPAEFVSIQEQTKKQLVM